MNVLGMVTEYNPFHNGHLYHLRQSKSLCNADCVVCVMSGNFTQRGEPAIVDKWARTEMALLSGIDLVIELPAVYAMSSAEFFAYGAVKILDSLGVVDYLSFGSEAGSIEELDAIADILIEEPEDYKSSLREYLDKGLSYPSAREASLQRYINSKSIDQYSIENIISNSNNILGIEYLKALKRLNSNIKPITIKRINNLYNSIELSGSVSSATSIRKHIASISAENTYTTLESIVSKHTLDILKREFDAGRGPVFLSNFESTILSSLRRMSVEEIKEFPYVSEGLENRIKTAADTSGTIEDLIETICTRRYTRTRIQRCILSILTGLKNTEFIDFNNSAGPQYIRILGFNKKGRQLLTKINKSSNLPVISKTADYKSSDNPLLSRMLHIEAASTDQYSLAFSNPEYKKSGQDYTRKIIKLSNP